MNDRFIYYQRPVQRQTGSHDNTSPVTAQLSAKQIPQQCAAQTQRHLSQAYAELVVAQDKVQSRDKKSIGRRSELRVARVVRPDDMTLESRLQRRQAEKNACGLRAVECGIIDKSHVRLIQHGYLKVWMRLKFVQIGQPKNHAGKKCQRQDDIPERRR